MSEFEPKIIIGSESVSFYSHEAASTIPTQKMPTREQSMLLRQHIRGYVQGVPKKIPIKMLPDAKGGSSLSSMVHGVSASCMFSLDLFSKKLETLTGYEDRILVEEKKRREEAYIIQSLDNSLVLKSPEIEKQIRSNRVFEILIKTALSEIAEILNEEWKGKIGYIVEISIVQDHEYPDWKDMEIEILVPIKDTGYILRLWDKVSDRVWDKVGSIKEDAEEIERISDNIRIAFDIL